MDSTIEKDADTPQILENNRNSKPSIKLITCIIRQEKLDPVKDSLNHLNLVGGMTVTTVRGFGRQKGMVEHYRGEEVNVRFIDKVKLELAVSSDDVDDVVETIQKNASSGLVGDGKVFISDIQEVMRIRTGEKGISAL